MLEKRGWGGKLRSGVARSTRSDLHFHILAESTLPVNGGGSRRRIAMNQSDGCGLRNPHAPPVLPPRRLVTYPDARCESGQAADDVPRAATLRRQ